jgi:hypothetical protein
VNCSVRITAPSVNLTNHRKSTIKNPLCQAMVQGDFFMLLFSAGVQFYSTLII